MKFSFVKSAMLSLGLCLGTTICSARTITVGPTGTYANPCAAFPNLLDGDTVQIDANGGTPYTGNTDCNINNNNLTIVGVNGRAVMDGTGIYTSKGLWIMNGHDNVVDNIEFGNASGQQNAAGIRIQIDNGGSGGSNGGNITVQHSYVHNCGTGILGANADPTTNWYSANPYITFQYDEFSQNGNLDGQGNTHNMYMGVGGNMNFTLQYSWTHDSFVGHTMKTRAPMNNILYNMDTDASGTSSFLLDFCLGGSDYVVGNVLYKGAVTNSNTSQNWFIFADVGEDNDGGEYPAAHQDLHFINNTVVDDPSNTYPPQYISMSCGNATQASCAAPNNGGPAETVAAVIENNIFVGPAGNAVSNQGSSLVENNVVQTYSASQLAADFVDWAHYDFHLASGSPAIHAGIYPPTNNAGTSDPKALAVYEFVMPAGIVTRPTPSGSNMDAGAYSYPRVGTAPTLGLSYTTTVTAPGTGTITITGLPTPPTGQYNFAAFVSGNTAAVPNPASVSSKTGTLTATFSVNPAVTQSTVVPIDVYAGGGHAVANVTVNPGPPVLSSITLDGTYTPFTSVHLQGPAPAGGTVISLSSSNPTYLYIPSSVTVPQGQITAETGSDTGSLWGQSPGNPTETATATQGSVVKTVSFPVFAPGFHSTGTEYTSITGGTPLAWCVVMVGFFPPSGGTMQVTSSNTAVIPNQTLSSGYGNCNGNFNGPVVNFTQGVNFNGDLAIVTNAVASTTTVNVTVTLNGASSGATAITVVPGGPVPASIAVVSGSGQSAMTGTNFANPLVAVVKTSGGAVVPNATVTFAGSGISFPNGATATTNSSGQASVVAQPTVTGALTVTASVAGVGTPASFSETGTASGVGDIIAINSSGSAAGMYVADTDYSGGTASSTGNTVDTSAVANPAPQAVYQTQRYGSSTYTIPGLTAGGSYTVLLHFAETYWSAAGKRVFNITINGAQVATNYDIYAAAGAANKATVKTYNAIANTSGQIVIVFTTVTDNAAINGIEVRSTTGAAAGINSDFSTSPDLTPGQGIYIYNPTNVANWAFAGKSGVAENGSAWGFNTPTDNANQVAFLQNTSAVTQTLTGLTNGQQYTVSYYLEDRPGFTANPVTVAAGGTNLVTTTPGTGWTKYSQTFTASGTTEVLSFSTSGSPSGDIDSGLSDVTLSTATGVALSSITLDSPYGSGTTVHLVAAAPTGGQVVTLSSSNTAIEYVPASVTVPAGQTSAETGSLMGSLWGQTPFNRSVTITGVGAGVTKTLTASIPTATLHAFSPNTSVKGGQQLAFYMETAFNTAPVGGGLYTISSDHSTIIPNQSFTLPAGQSNDFGKFMNTNTVTSTTTVNVTLSYNGQSQTTAVSVTP